MESKKKVKVKGLKLLICIHEIRIVSHENEANSSPITIQHASLLSHTQMFTHTHIYTCVHAQAYKQHKKQKINQDEQSLSERAVAH